MIMTVYIVDHTSGNSHDGSERHFCYRDLYLQVFLKGRQKLNNLNADNDKYDDENPRTDIIPHNGNTLRLGRGLANLHFLDASRGRVHTCRVMLLTRYCIH